MQRLRLGIFLLIMAAILIALLVLGNILPFSNDTEEASSFYLASSDGRQDTAEVYGIPKGVVVGGGAGYADIVSDGDYIIDTTNTGKLCSYLARAQAGQTIFIRPNVTIRADDVSGCLPLWVPDDVTLASNRGEPNPDGSVSQGAKFYYNKKSPPVFIRVGKNARVTGLRVISSRFIDTDGHGRTGVHMSNHEGATVDNCVLSYWDYNIVAQSPGEYHIHNNVLYNATYNVLVNSLAMAVVKANQFGTSFHHIASNGKRGSSYIALYNYFGSSQGQSVDMHGWSERCRPGFECKKKEAGGLIVVRNNEFEQSGGPSIAIRGRPRIGAFIFNNLFHSSNNSFKGNRGIVYQSRYSGNFFSYNNKYQGTGEVYYISGESPDEEALVFLNNPSSDSVAVGDFYGDGQIEFIRSHTVRTLHGEFLRVVLQIGQLRDDLNQISRFVNNEHYVVDWKVIKTSKTSFGQLLFGDFNGNGTTGILRISGRDWYISYDTSTPWTHVRTTSIPVDRLRLGDFNDDGKSDVFSSWNGYWQISYGATQKWKTVKKSDAPMNELLVGDFDGNDKDDVLWVKETGEEWLVSYGASSKWRKIRSTATDPVRRSSLTDSRGTGGPAVNVNTAPVHTLRVGDINGDGVSDIFRASGGNWSVSYGADTPWREVKFSASVSPGMNPVQAPSESSSGGSIEGAPAQRRKSDLSDVTVENVWLGDFDGDSATEVLTVSRSTVF